MKILALINDTTFPVNSGPRVRNHFLWPALARLGHDVRILALDPRRGAVQSSGPPDIDCLYFPTDRAPFPQRALNAACWSYHHWPHSRALLAELDGITRDWQPDIIHAEHLKMAAYLPAVRGEKNAGAPHRAPLQSVTFHNVESDLIQRTGSAASRFRFCKPLVQKLHLRNLLALERRVAQSVDIAFAYSKIDEKRYRQLIPAGRWSSTTGGVNAAEVQALPDVPQRSVLLLGTLSYQPNLAGLLWLLDRVRPGVSTDISFTVAGANATDETRVRLKREPVVFLDSPPEVAPLYAEHAISCIPLFDGSGSRGRILESLAFGRMVITTPKGAEGLAIPPNHGIIIAETADEMIAALDRWSSPSPERTAQCIRGRAFVLEHFDWSLVARRLADQWSHRLHLQPLAA